MRTELVHAFTLLFDEAERVDGDETCDVMAEVEALAIKMLTDEEFIAYSDGYDKDGHRVVGFKTEPITLDNEEA